MAAVGLAFVAYSALLSAEVVVAGEHYLIDVAGAAVAGAVVALAAARGGRVLASGRAFVRNAWARTGRRTLRPEFSSERGQALIELAFILPVMLVFLLVLVDFGLALDRREVIQHAAREGARQGAVGLGPAGVETETIDQSQGLLSAADINVCYVDGPDAGTALGNVGDNVRVEIDYDYEFTAGSGELLSTLGLGPPSINMNPHAEARLETTITGATAC
jgi:hypothetical protein